VRGAGDAYTRPGERQMVNDLLVALFRHCVELAAKNKCRNCGKGAESRVIGLCGDSATTCAVFETI